jgi:hypothetical protein
MQEDVPQNKSKPTKTNMSRQHLPCGKSLQSANESAVMQSAMSNSLIASIFATLSSSYSSLGQYTHKLPATTPYFAKIRLLFVHVALLSAAKGFDFPNVPSILFAVS